DGRSGNHPPGGAGRLRRRAHDHGRPGRARRRQAAVRRLRPDGAPRTRQGPPVTPRDPHHLPHRALTGSQREYIVSAISNTIWWQQLGGDMGKDFFDEMVEERSKKNPEFPEMVDAALRARRLIRSLAERRL